MAGAYWILLMMISAAILTKHRIFKYKKERKIVMGFSNLSGKGNWGGLLDPLNDDLCRYIIHYGQMAGACGDLFNTETRKCQATKEDFFFKMACLDKGNKHKYKVTKFFEAGSPNVKPAWSGYVAESDGKEAMGRIDILIAWRGPATDSEWGVIGQDPWVHGGLSLLYYGITHEDLQNNTHSPRYQVLEEVKKLLDENKDKEITITVTGFSLGAALATMNALDIIVNGYNKPKCNPNKSFMVTAFVFGGPHVGNTGFKEAIDANNSKLHILRITNSADGIPKLLEPGRVVSFLSEVTDLFKNNKDFLIEDFKYTHVGKELKVNCKDSPYLKDPIRGRSEDYSYPVDQFLYEDRDGGGSDSSYEWFSPHNMDVYLHAVAGPRKDNLCLAVDHDIALVNKYLNHNYEIPDKWWEGPNSQRTTQQEDGHWKVDNMYEIRAPLRPSSDVEGHIKGEGDKICMYKNVPLSFSSM